jgi:outer membrane protein assembly factor BamB
VSQPRGPNVHITAVCPRCHNRYHLNPSLRGQKIQCPNTNCREVFEVQDADTAFDRNEVVIASGKISKGKSASDLVPILPAEEAPSQTPPSPAPPPEKSRQPNHVADFLPLVPAEPAENPQPSTEQTFASWHDAPPVRGKEGQPAPPAPTSPPRKTPPPRQPEPAPRQPTRPPSTPELPAGQQEGDWRSAPPPAATPGSPRSKLPAGPPASPPSDQPPPTPPRDNIVPGPVELKAGQWEAPPVRRRGPSDTPEPHGVLPSPPGEMHPPSEPEHGPSTKTRRAKRLMLGMVVGVLGFLGIAGGVAWYLLSQGEQRQFGKAWDDYKEERFRDAGDKFRKLVEKFPESGRRDEYAFLADLADLRATLSGGPMDMRAALERVGRFLDEHPDKSDEQKKLFVEYGDGLGSSFLKRVESYLDQNEQNDTAEFSALLDLIEGQVQAVRKRIPDAVSEGDVGRIAGRIGQSRARIARAEKKRQILVKAREMARDASPTTVKELKKFFEAQAAEFPGLENDPEARKIIEDVYATHRKRVRYVKAERGTPRGAPPGREDDLEPGILLDPLVQGRPREANDDGDVALALSRGVLYALSAATGRTKWALRVGIDTDQLPIRLPPTPAHPAERLLVLSADTRTLRTLDLDGRQLWSYRLSASALGRPVLIQRRGALIAYVPTHDGNVHEIELAQGTLRGHFELGSPLTLGGVHRKGTNLIYFPADDSCVYVLDVEQKECVAVIYTNHADGPLLGEPLIVGETEAGVAGAPVAPAYLVLSQADGLDTTALRVFQLPAGSGNAEEVTMKAPPRIRGWTWFPPYHDGEKVVCLSDAGRLGLFGIRQVRNDDRSLFALVPPPASEPPAVREGHTDIDLAELLGGPAAEVSRERSMVAHVQGDEFWVLAQGQFQRLALGLSGKKGPRASPLWESPLRLGSPLHGPQVLDGPLGQSLYLLTQPLKRPVHLATAIDPEAMPDATAEQDPRILWQRQLGMVCQGEPVVLGNEVVAIDQGCGLFRFDPRQFKARSDGQWQVGGQIIAAGLDHNPAFTPLLLRGEEGFYQLALPGDGKELVLRRYRAAGRRPDVSEERLALAGALAGDPVLVGETLVLPLADGRLVRYSLPLAKAVANPINEIKDTNWRARYVPPDARCYVAALGPDGLLSTNGSRGLTRWSWPWDDKKIYQAVLPPENKTGEPPTVELPARIVSAPLVLPGKKGDPLRVLVADARGVVTLLRGDHLTPARTWDLGGTITTGPFLRGGHLGCVVDRERLVWLDPDKKEKLWEYRMPGDIVGQPALVEDLIVVCDEAGHFIGLDPETGLRQGPGYTLKAAVAPAATPVAFGPGRAFAPLTDGTILMLSLHHLRVSFWLRPLFAQ